MFDFSLGIAFSGTIARNITHIVFMRGEDPFFWYFELSRCIDIYRGVLYGAADNRGMRDLNRTTMFHSNFAWLQKQLVCLHLSQKVETERMLNRVQCG